MQTCRYEKLHCRNFRIFQCLNENKLFTLETSDAFVAKSEDQRVSFSLLLFDLD